MPLPFLAFMGLGFGANYLNDKYNEFTSNSDAADIASRAAKTIGSRGTEQAGPRRERYQGVPLMSRGTGMMGGEISPQQGAVNFMEMGGRYGDIGQQMIEQQFGLKAPPRLPNIQTVQSGSPGGMQVPKQIIMGPNGPIAVPIQGVDPRKAGGGVTITNMPDLPAGYMATDPTDLSKGVTPIPGGPKDESSPGTGEEKTAYGFLQRQEAASQGMSDVVAADAEQGIGSFTDIKGNLNLTGAQMAAGRMGPSVAESSILNDAQQQYMQFARDWIRAKLRKESGAVINKDEWADEYQTFFPMPGDSEAVINQKRQSRKTSENSMRTMAGSAAPKQRKAGDTWSDANYDYRVTESGEIQRKAK